MTPARGPAVTFDLAAAADGGQRDLGPSASGAPVGTARPYSERPGNQPGAPSSSTNSFPTLQQVTLSPFVPSTTGYLVGLGTKVVLGLLGWGGNKRGKVSSSAHRMGDIARLSFPAVFQACLSLERVLRGPKVASPSAPRGVCGSGGQGGG